MYVIKRLSQDEVNKKSCEWFGLKLSKTATLKELVKKLSKKWSISPDKLSFAEINGNRYVKVISVNNKNNDMKIWDLGLRSRRIFTFEQMDTLEYQKRFIKEPKIIMKRKEQNTVKYYNSISELKPFQIVDAQDYRGDWYRGIVLGGKIRRRQDLSVKIHFIEFGDKWDEFYSDDNINKIAPPGTYAEEPSPKEFTLTVYHQVNQSYFEGIPILVTLSSEMTWDEAYEEIVSQWSRFINLKSSYFKERMRRNKLEKHKVKDVTRCLTEIIEEPPFKIIFVESTGKKWFFCSLEAKVWMPQDKERRSELEKWRGWDMKRGEDKIKWLLNCSKNQSIYLAWSEDDFKDIYMDIECFNHKSASKLIDIEAQRENGISLTEWLELFVKEDTLDDYQWDVSATFILINLEMKEKIWIKD